MHIPDGYLSPSTCAVLYAAAMPFWAAALRRVRALLATRFVPLVSLFAAFSFVIMMFNLPLPGGTTGHAAGIAMAAIVLGPWGATIAISVALAIQALLFGDGGILALGANCFNMAVAGVWTAAAVYRLIAGDTVEERILVLQDGERTGDLSSASADHALSIDPFSADRIEVIRGPASLLYGRQCYLVMTPPSDAVFMDP